MLLFVRKNSNWSFLFLLVILNLPISLIFFRGCFFLSTVTSNWYFIFIIDQTLLFILIIRSWFTTGSILNVLTGVSDCCFTFGEQFVIPFQSIWVHPRFLWGFIISFQCNILWTTTTTPIKQLFIRGCHKWSFTYNEGGIIHAWGTHLRVFTWD